MMDQLGNTHGESNDNLQKASRLQDEYEALKRGYLTGWHTWNVNSVLSHVHMPDGLALNLCVKEYTAGGYLRETLIGRFPEESARTPKETAFPGAHALDESYTDMHVSWCGLAFRVESAVDGDELVLLVTPEKQQPKPPMLVLESGYLWNRPGVVSKTGPLTLEALGGERRTTVYAGEGSAIAEDPNLPCQGAYLAVVFDGPVAFSTGTPRTVAAVRGLLDRNRVALNQKYARLGSKGSLLEAIESAMGWDTIYDAKHNRCISPVSRLWSIGSGGYVLFCWDNYFAGFMASLVNKELAYSNLIEITNERTADGFVPNFAYATGQKSADRSQPPVGSAMLLEVYRRYRERWIVELLFPALLAWNTWFFENRRTETGAFSWGSNPIPVLYGNRWETDGVEATFGAAMESGLDNSPMYDDIPFDTQTHRMCLEDVGLTGLFILDCRSLETLAKLLGRGEDLKLLEQRKAVAEAGLETLWDEREGFYYNRRTDTGAFSRRISPCNFYALFSEKITADRVRRMVDGHYFNPEEFYGAWMIPSIARNDAAFQDQDYWRGRIWAPLNFLVYMAMLEHDVPDARKDLADKSVALFMKEWEAHGHIHENYNGITGAGCDAHNSDKFYHWGALLCAIGLAEDGAVEGFRQPLIIPD
jgi:hypothetical protein